MLKKQVLHQPKVTMTQQTMASMSCTHVMHMCSLWTSLSMHEMLIMSAIQRVQWFLDMLISNVDSSLIPWPSVTCL